MVNITDIKGVIFDYGGTIDSRGVHWSEVIWQGYEASGVIVDKVVFRDAYVYAERLLAKQPLIKPDYTFYDLMLVKITHELKWLCEQQAFPENSIEVKAKEIARYCYEAARECVEEARPVIEILYSRFPLVMVSNFYGNLHSVLSDYDILQYFDTVVESAVVGVRKPDSAIFQLGVNALNMRASEVLVIGDSYSKDIEPAMLLGCRAIWLKGKGWDKDPENKCGAFVVSKLDEVLPFLQCDK